MAKDFTQQEGTIRVVLSLTLHHGWSLQQLDVSNVFFHGNLDEVIFLSQPPDFQDSQFLNHVCRLNKAFYGLKRAPRAWFSIFSKFLLSIGFVSSHADASFFVHSTPLHSLFYCYMSMT